VGINLNRWKRLYWSLLAKREVARQTFHANAKMFGRADAVRLLMHPVLPRRVDRLRGVRYSAPLYFRPRTSDPKVICSVLAQQDYQAVADLANVRLIVDCGANIGCTTFFLLHAYEHARAIVIEPDPSNMAMCRRNLHPFRHRVQFLECAVWPESVPLIVERGHYRDGAEWAFQVRPARPDERADMVGITIDEIMRTASVETIDLLKIDIEAAEQQLFAGENLHWLRHTRNIAIELHGEFCEIAFDRALRGFEFSRSQHGELTICTGIRQRDNRDASSRLLHQPSETS
jgi:FkbM family methyltransferase